VQLYNSGGLGRTTCVLDTIRLWLGVESIESPGNLGTIIRTAEATGIGRNLSRGY
jgi:tRNA G18 (ribose-2'-O)-methylase SpoU